jgi:hypothetical protein
VPAGLAARHAEFPITVKSLPRTPSLPPWVDARLGASLRGKWHGWPEGRSKSSSSIGGEVQQDSETAGQCRNNSSFLFCQSTPSCLNLH